MIHFEIEGKALVEIWKPIKGYEDSYLVSTLGRIKSKPRLGTRGGILKELYSRWQYNRVNLYKGGEMKSFFIHRLVAKEFLPNPENKPQVNHKDGNKLNNALSNLEWVTQSENQLHAYETGLQKVDVKKAHEVRHEQTKRKVAKLDEQGNRIEVFDSIKSAAKSIGMNDGTHISAVARGKRERCGGFKWEYISR